MNISEIKTFLVAAENLSFSEAAKHLYITQSAVSRRIARLEEEMKTTLFLRTGPAIKLTEAGKVFYIGSKKLIDRFEKIVTDTVMTHNGTNGRINIVCNYNQYNQNVLNKILDLIRHELPGIDVEVKWGVSGEVMNNIMEGNADLALCEQCTFSDLSGLEVKTLLKSQWILILEENNAFNKKTNINITDLDGVDMVLWNRQIAPNVYDMLIETCRQKGVKLKINYHTNSPEDTYLAVLSGKGVTVSSKGYVGSMKGLVEIPIDGLPGSPDYCIAWLSKNTNPVLPRVMQILDDTKFI